MDGWFRLFGNLRETQWQEQDTTLALIPKGATLLTVERQNNIPVLYAEVDPNALLEFRRILVLGTGSTCQIPQELRQYLGTTVLSVAGGADNFVLNFFLTDESLEGHMFKRVRDDPTYETAAALLSWRPLK